MYGRLFFDISLQNRGGNPLPGAKSNIQFNTEIYNKTKTIYLSATISIILHQETVDTV